MIIEVLLDDGNHVRKSEGRAMTPVSTSKATGAEPLRTAPFALSPPPLPRVTRLPLLASGLGRKA